MVKTYQQVNREQRESEREEHHERKHRKYTLLIIVALLVAFVGIMLAQNAQDTADINNVFEIVVNNTNLAPTVAGHPPGTGERVSGATYWANDSPIEIFVFAHAMAVGDNAEIHLFINGTKVADTSGRPLGGAESSNKTIIAIIPKFSNYSVEFTNFHHYEWREYPVLSGKNGTLSVNQTVLSNGSEIAALQRNDTYFNGSIFPNSTNFRNNTIFDYFESRKLNKTKDDTMTGTLTINASSSSANYLLNLVTNGVFGLILTNNHTGVGQGAGIQAINNHKSATLKNERLGFMLFKGAEDSINTLSAGAGFSSYATQDYTNTVNGANLTFETTHNGSGIRTVDFSIENGNVSIGTKNASSIFIVGDSGDGTQAWANSWNTYSSQEYKTEIQNATWNIPPIQPISYKQMYDNSSVTYYGFKAEELPPGLRTTDGFNIGVNAMAIIAYQQDLLNKQQKMINKICTNQPSLCV